jgi:hypothetical protein
MLIVSAKILIKPVKKDQEKIGGSKEIRAPSPPLSSNLGGEERVRGRSAMIMRFQRGKPIFKAIRF